VRQRRPYPLPSRMAGTSAERQRRSASRAHLVPRSRGGRDTYDNLTLRHLYCHQQLHGGAAPAEPADTWDA
jgi:hypothetical protein